MTKPKPKAETSEFQWVRSRAGVTKVLADLRIGDAVDLVLVPITDDIWCWEDAKGVHSVRDANEVSFDGEVLYAAINGTILENYVLSSCYEDEEPSMTGTVRLRKNAGNAEIRVTADHVARIRLRPQPKKVKFDGLEHDVILQLDKSVKVGCQTITPTGVEQAVRALAEHLGYTLTPTK